jgi:hypothetical protein
MFLSKKEKLGEEDECFFFFTKKEDKCYDAIIKTKEHNKD